MEDRTGRTIRLRDGGRLGYAEWGDTDGRPLLYFHGWPGARVEGRLGAEVARAKGIRFIALDRPGMGLSDYQPRRTFVDWPIDVAELAAALGLDRFAVLGISGGGPYAAACAWKLSERLTGAGIARSRVSRGGGSDASRFGRGNGRRGECAPGSHRGRCPVRKSHGPGLGLRLRRFSAGRFPVSTILVSRLDDRVDVLSVAVETCLVGW